MNMVHLTEAAVEHIKHKMAEEPGSMGVQVSIKDGGCSGYEHDVCLVKEAPSQSVCVTQAGLCIYIPLDDVSKLKGLLLDFVDKGLGEQQLVFHNPNASNPCGCGKSIEF